MPENEQPWPAVGSEAAQRLREAAVAVRAAQEADPTSPSPGASRVDAEVAAEVAGWERVVEALLAERQVRSVPALPAHLSASQVVALADDARSALLDLARPVPRRPHRQARRGSRFHEWVESRSGTRQGLFEPEDLVGAADDAEADDVELAELKARFEASEWASAQVLGVEVPFATPLTVGDGRVVLRGRIDAVVRSSQPGLELDVVDWKTGRPPAAGLAGARSAQLAVYRLAVSRLFDVPLHRIGAAFWFGSVPPAGLTARPEGLLDETGLAALLGPAGTGA